MRSKHRLFMFAGLVAGAIALGCQNPQATGSKPRVQVAFDTTYVDPNADMAIRLLREDCGDKGYGLKQVPTIDPRVAYLMITVESPNLVGGIPPRRIERSEFTACTAVVNFSGLPPGEYTIRYTAYTAADQPVAFANGTATVSAGATQITTLNCDFNTGELDVTINCCNASPTPTPTPTPVPAASGTLAPCVNAVVSYPPHALPTYFERVHGLAAGRNGSVYLFGIRSQPWPNAFENGASVELEHNGAVNRAGMASVNYNQYVLYEGDWGPLDATTCARNSLNGVAPGVPLAETPPTQVNYTSFLSYLYRDIHTHYLRQHTGYITRPWAASASWSNNSMAISYGTSETNLASYTIRQVAGGPATMTVDRSQLIGGRSAAIERPISIIKDQNRNFPIWTSYKGILKPGPHPSADPIVLVNQPAYGITKLDENADSLPNNDRVLFTTYTDGDTKVYYADLATSNPPTVAYTFARGIPHRIERGDDGFFYVLLQEGPLPSDAASGNNPYMYEFPGTNHVRAVRMRFSDTGNQLIQPELLLDSFTPGAASW